MRTKTNKWIAIGLATGLSLSLFAGCQKNEQKNNKDAEIGTLKDGTWTVEAEKFDDHGWKPGVTIEVADGKITTVNFDYVNQDGQSKKADEGYNTAMKEKSGTNPAEAFPQLEQQLVEKQDIDQVDIVTGATSSSESFKAMAKEALQNASK
ncbi:MAG: FMN-binding protein [Epulopiscium sp.]|nr:FMN-binding protein [Candidatus Epulonipiscium sp.]